MTLVMFPFISGCVVLVPLVAAPIIAHSVQKSNNDYDNIIVNFGYKYEAYYNELTELNKKNKDEEKPYSKILPFKDWIEKEAESDKEKKAVTRYKKIHSNEP